MAAADHASAEALAGVVPAAPALAFTYDLVRARDRLSRDGRAAWRDMLRAFLRHIQAEVDPVALLGLAELVASLLAALEDLDRNVVDPRLRPAVDLGGAGSTLAVVRARALAAAAVARLRACGMTRDQACHAVAGAFAGLEPPSGRKPKPEVTPADVAGWHRGITRSDGKAASPRERELFDIARELFAGEPPAEVAYGLRRALEELLPRRR